MSARVIRPPHHPRPRRRRSVRRAHQPWRPVAAVVVVVGAAAALAAAIIVGAEAAVLVTRAGESIALLGAVVGAAWWLWQDHRTQARRAARPHAVGAVVRVRSGRRAAAASGSLAA